MSLLNLPIPHSISGLILAMESLHVPRGPYVSDIAPTGEPFMEFTVMGLSSSAPQIASFFTPEAAIRTFWNEFVRYSATRSGFKLYWRRKPVLEAHIFNIDGINRDTYLVTSRFVLSNRQPVSRDLEEECLGLRRKVA